MSLQWDREALELCRIAEKAGFPCVIVGGAVRDVLRGVKPADYDLAAGASAQQLLGVFKGAQLTGGEWGTVSVSRGGRWYQITPFRAEKGYADGRHPDSVQFGVSLEEDLARRDLTINAMAWDGEKLIDPFGGREDLEKHVIRVVGDPMRRFSEDGLRILRMFRFASMMDFSVDPETLDAALRCQQNLFSVSSPRLRNELQGVLLGAAPQVIEPLLRSGGLCMAGFLAPRVPGALKAMSNVPKNMLLRWWAFLELIGADKRKVCTSMDFSRDFYAALVRLDLYFREPTDSVTLKWRAAKLKTVSMKDMLAAFRALDARFAENEAEWNRIKNSGEPYRPEQMAVNGRLLIAQGLRGEAIGRRLRALRAAVYAQPELNRQETLLALSATMDQLELYER